MKNWKDDTTIEISTPDGKTTGPIPAKEFSRRVKEGLKKMAASNPTNSTNPKDKYSDKPDYWRDSALDKLAEEVRMKHHEHLHDAEISYLMTKKPMNRGGKAIAGKAKLSKGLIGFYSKADFIIIIDAAYWDNFDVPQRRALVDHELKHCSYEDHEEGNRTWIIRGHDIEEFTDIVDRHGLWHDDLKTFDQAVGRQLELGLNEKAGDKKAS